MDGYLQTLLNDIHREANRIKEQITPATYMHAVNILANVILIEEELKRREHGTD